MLPGGCVLSAPLPAIACLLVIAGIVVKREMLYQTGGAFGLAPLISFCFLHLACCLAELSSLWRQLKHFHRPEVCRHALAPAPGEGVVLLYIFRCAL